MGPGDHGASLPSAGVVVRSSQIEKMRDPLSAEWNVAPGPTPGAEQTADELLYQIDLSLLNEIFDNFLAVVGLPVAVIDLQGKVLASSKWQRLCMDFHRVNPGTLTRCLASDTDLSRQMQEGKDFAIYRCKNGLTDTATRIVVEGRHVANLFIGQFMLAPPDAGYFRAQQEEFGFDAKAYTEALSEIPIVAEDRLPALLRLMGGMAQQIARQSVANIRVRKAYAVVEQQVVERTRELADLNIELQQFAYVASHDMREPLRMISSYLALLKRRLGNDLDQDCRDFLGFAKDGAQRLDRMILSLLDYSRIGRDSQPKGQVALGEALDEAIANLGVAIETAQARIAIPAPLPVVPGNRDELVRLLQNLIANSVKYRSPDRLPVVTISARREDSFWQLSIADNGVGIAPENRDRIFGIFQRLHGVDVEGSGIGLAIVKKIVQHHGGHIWVEGEPGVGSTFHFTLPDVSPSAGKGPLEASR